VANDTPAIFPQERIPVLRMSIRLKAASLACRNRAQSAICEDSSGALDHLAYHLTFVLSLIFSFHMGRLDENPAKQCALFSYFVLFT